ncbi:hypothetical protein E3N88_40348 [Mikania micrantha]|uniref:CCHC-type domain-containing protein n=1 Tax=Mikania micrantha TaxID=192012 RepID=A0A5N6LN84_9ASTR|nr:hypothetical protein E3N88_40348 [Mikania micrantha]
MVLSADPTTLRQAVYLAHELTDTTIIQGLLPPRGSIIKTTDNKRKCNNCDYHHKRGPCERYRCQWCGKRGHTTKNCRGKLVTKIPQPQPQQYKAPKGCFGCGKPGHFKRDCPHAENNGDEAPKSCFECGKPGHLRKDCPYLGNDNNKRNNNGPKEQPLVIGAKEARNDPNLATEDEYTVDLDDDKLIATKHIIRECTLELANHRFKIDLMPVTLGRKLNLRYIGPFEILKRIGPVAYQLNLPAELDGVHNVFHVSNRKKWLLDETLVIPLDVIQVDEQLRFVGEPVEIADREVKRLKQSRIPIARVRWNSKRGPEFTWERKDQMMRKYPHLFKQTTEIESSESKNKKKDPSRYAITPWRKSSRYAKKTGSRDSRIPSRYAIKDFDRPPRLEKELGSKKPSSTARTSSSEAVTTQSQWILTSKVLTSRTASFHSHEHHINRNCFIRGGARWTGVRDAGSLYCCHPMRTVVEVEHVDRSCCFEG